MVEVRVIGPGQLEMLVNLPTGKEGLKELLTRKEAWISVGWASIRYIHTAEGMDNCEHERLLSYLGCYRRYTACCVRYMI